MSKTLAIVLLTFALLTSHAAGEEKAAVRAGVNRDGGLSPAKLVPIRRAYPGIQTTTHSAHRANGRGYGHQGITKGGDHWFLFGTRHIYRYESDDFTIDQAKLKIKNEDPFGHADFNGTGIEHMGAPHFHNGKVYSFAKTSNKTPFAKAKMRLVWYSADDLSYTKGSYRDLRVPPDADGNPRVVAGGPFIVGELLYAALYKKSLDGKKLPSSHIGRFSLKTGKFLEAVRVSKLYHIPQALVMDRAGNFYVMETRGHLKKYSANGEYVATVFEAGFRAIYEGFFLDRDARVMTVSITWGDGNIHIARIELQQE